MTVDRLSIDTDGRVHLRSANTAAVMPIHRQVALANVARAANPRRIGRRRVVVAGTTTTIVEALAAALAGQSDLDVVSIALQQTDVFELVVQRRPDVAVLYVPQLDEEVIESTGRLKAVAPELRVVLLSARPDLQLLTQAATVGVAACLSLDTGLHDLIGAIRADTTDTMLVDALSLSLGPPARRTAAVGQGSTPLTRRELQVLALLAEGCSPPAIASRLIISIYTARGHVKNVLRKLDAHSQLEAVAAASRMGLLAHRGSSPTGVGPHAERTQMALAYDDEPLGWRRDA